MRMNLPAATGRELASRKAIGGLWSVESSSRDMPSPGFLPRRGPRFYEGVSRTCKPEYGIHARPASRTCDPEGRRSPLAAARARLLGVESELEVVHPAELIVHLEERLDDGPD